MVCVDRFMAAPDVGVQLTALKGMERSYQQSKSSRRRPGGDRARQHPPRPQGDADDRKAAGCAPRSSRSPRFPAGEPGRPTMGRPWRNRRTAATARERCRPWDRICGGLRPCPSRGIVGALLIGSLPGIYIGSHLAAHIADRFLLPALASMLMLLGLRLIAS